jgi:hypothetical protein
MWYRPTHEGRRKALAGASQPIIALPRLTCSAGHDVDVRRREEIASQAEDTLRFIAMHPYDAGGRPDPTILEDLPEQVGQAHRGLEEVWRLVTGGRA